MARMRETGGQFERLKRSKHYTVLRCDNTVQSFFPLKSHDMVECLNTSGAPGSSGKTGATGATGPPGRKRNDIDPDDDDCDGPVGEYYSVIHKNNNVIKYFRVTKCCEISPIFFRSV